MEHPLIDRFWSKVDRSGGPDACWPWLGGRGRQGYGVFHIQRHPTRASRFAVQTDGRTLAAGQIVMHTCDNPPCVNPAHLVIATTRDNVRDMYAKGRGGYIRTPETRRRLSASLKATFADDPRNSRWQRSKTACPQGHPYDEPNTFVDRNGHRHCRACNRDRARARKAR